MTSYRGLVKFKEQNGNSLVYANERSGAVFGESYCNVSGSISLIACQLFTVLDTTSVNGTC